MREMTEPLSLFDDIFSDLGPAFKEVIESKVLKYEDIEGELELMDPNDTEEVLGEAGAPICMKDGHFHLGRVREPCVGAGCRIDSYCEVGRKVGSFHTHPLVGVWPSIPDMETSSRESEVFFCIGGRLKDDRPYAACYISTGKKLFINPFVPFYQFSEEPRGNIRFWRQEPEMETEELLSEVFSDRDLAWEFGDEPEFEDIECDTEEELGARIRERILETGDMPERYYDFADSPEGEWDTLDSYAPEQGERLMGEAFDRLALYYNAQGRYL